MKNEIKPYLNMKQLGLALDVSQPFLRKVVDGIRKEISEGRYPEYVIAGRHISLYAVIDYLTYREALKDNALRKKVPQFDPIPIARLCGQEGVQV